MRIVFSGAGPMTIITTRALTKQGHEVIIIEVDKEKIIVVPVLSQQIDLIIKRLRLADSDQANIITALLGRSMGFKRVVPSIEDAELQQLCGELELEDTIIPVRTMSQYLGNMVRGLDNIELSTVLKHDARLFTFVAGKEESRKIKELDLPEDTEVLFFYRKDQFNFVDSETALKESDEVVILTHSKNLTDLQKRWNPKQADEDD